jgi:LacI family transcriptional regulator
MLKSHRTTVYDIARELNLTASTISRALTNKKSMQQLLAAEAMPDAVFSSSDLGAIGALQVLKEHNIRIPEQVALVGFSNEPFTMFCDPPLTTIDQHCKRMGNIASEIFLDEVKNAGNAPFLPKKIVLMPELIIRRSSLKSSVLNNNGKP